MVEMALGALAHALDHHHGLKLVDFVAEWFWDGYAGAMQTLSTHFPAAETIALGAREAKHRETVFGKFLTVHK